MPRPKLPTASIALFAVAAIIVALLVTQAGLTTAVAAATPPSPPPSATAPEISVPQAPTPPAEGPAPAPRPPKPPSSKQEMHSGKGSTLILNDDGDEVTWIWSEGNHKVRAEMNGDVVFSGAGMAVESISRGGYFMIEERVHGKSRELEIVPGRTDTLEYYYSENRETRPYDESARRWFSELLPALMRETGLGAAERVAALRADGGVTGVLLEVSLVSSDYVKRMYLEELLESGPLTADEVRALFRQVGREMDSDYEKAELLIDYADYTGDDVETRDAYVEAVAGIGSDYEKRRVLEGLLMPRMADEAFVEKVLGIAETIDSDFERVELLIRMADHAVAHDQSLSAYLLAVETVDSDFEARRALSALPWHDGISDQVCIDLLRFVSRLESDFEKAEFLLEYGEHFTQSDAVRDAFDRAVDSIDSDYERQRVEASFYRHSRKSGSGRETY